MNTFFLSIGLVFVLSFAFVYGSLFLIARAEVLLSQLKAQGAETVLASDGTLVAEEAIKSDADEVLLWDPDPIVVIHFESSANKVVLLKQRTPTVSWGGSSLAATSRANSYDFGQLRTA